MLEWLHHLHSSEGISQIIAWAGMLAPFLLAFIIFAETGLLIGFFLPGDSLLITAGALANPANHNHIAGLNILVLNLILALAATAGNQTGYFLGHKLGDRVWQRPDSRFFKRRHLEEAHAFYMRWGGLAIFAARFIPIFRTFTPFAAGMARMPYRRFVFWDVVGGVIWITSVLWAGYLLSRLGLANRLDKLIVIVIFVSFLPIIFGALARWWKARAGKAPGETMTPTVPSPEEGK
jgi:membrane-associated protein